VTIPPALATWLRLQLVPQDPARSSSLPLPVTHEPAGPSPALPGRRGPPPTEPQLHHSVQPLARDQQKQRIRAVTRMSVQAVTTR
jgi:hypothetical protein